MIYTRDPDALQVQLKQTGPDQVPPVKTPEYKSGHCCDLYGNEIVVAEIEAA